MSNILEVNNLCKKYDSFELKNVNFSLQRGYIMGFIGPNGAGKTTTIKTILGAIKPEKGSVNCIDNSKIGVVMDNPFFPFLSKIAHIEKAFPMFYENWNQQAFDKYLKKFGIEKKKKVMELSRGMKMKLQLAVAFSHNAELLILDEPTSGLDVLARNEICEILQDFVCDEKKSILFSTHIVSDLEKTADFITFILDGGVIYSGTKDELIENYKRISGARDVSIPNIIGKRVYKNGFEGLIAKENAKNIKEDVLIEDANLEEILIFLSKGAIENE
jgi:ABC-2 type transport system ATP-binding protein